MKERTPLHLQLLVASNLGTVIAGLAMGAAVAQENAAVQKIPINPIRNAYFGDLHLHTNYSFDSYLGAGRRIDPDGAYRFARGDTVRHLDDEFTRSTPPLDFLAVTDHAEWMGVLNTLEDPDSSFSQSDLGKKISMDLTSAWRAAGGGWPTRDKSLPGADTEATLRSTWQRTIEAANRYYEPGKFTTFIAYEWTVNFDKGFHLHRNVIFRGSTAPLPFSSMDSNKPEDLWGYLENARRQGYEVLAIPHNANASNGVAFDWAGSEGRRVDRAYAERRAKNEPLVEIAQHKGQSETHPVLSPNDEFADFEIIPKAWTKGNEEGSYIRDALGRGLTLARQAEGVNPFKFGFVGASDFHRGLSDSAENAFAGYWGPIDPRKDVVLSIEQEILAKRPMTEAAKITSEVKVLTETSSGALTGVWAESNTRESIYAALRRKETFASSGTRLKCRFFGGWKFDQALLENRDWVRRAYAQGTPMGGDLQPQPMSQMAPEFVLWAIKDPDGANLDRLQVVKVWLEGGKHSETVYDVAFSNGRKINAATGKVPAVGNTVNVKNASYTNTIGAVELAGLWRDPDFHANVPAVYYLRVLEIPTPRWSTILAVKNGRPLPDHVPATIQERAWSSPIWYNGRE